MDPNIISTSEEIISNTTSWVDTYKDLLLVLAGGLCATFGGLIGTWYQSLKARKIKREETIGRQQVDAYKKALRLANNLSSILIQGEEDDVLGYIKKYNEWVIDNEILLPPKFAQYWHSVRSNVRSIKRKGQSIHRMDEGSERDKKIDDLIELDGFVDKLAKDAEKEIRKQLKLPDFKIHRPPKKQK
jgi:hypothetical protein